MYVHITDYHFTYTMIVHVQYTKIYMFLNISYVAPHINSHNLLYLTGIAGPFLVYGTEGTVPYIVIGLHFNLIHHPLL